MDITNLVSNSALLKTLAVEFKALKASKDAPNIDFNAWMRQRLREAQEQPQQQQPRADGAAQTASQAAQRAALSGAAAAAQQPAQSTKQLAGKHSLRATTASRTDAVNNLRPASQARSGHTTSTTHAAPGGQARQQQGWAAEALTVSGQGPPPLPLAAPASVGPLLSAAAERERLIALSAALAKQHVQLGISTAAQRATLSEQSHDAATAAVEQLSHQQAQLVQLVQATQQQLQEHKDLLVAMMQRPDGSTPHHPSTAAAAGPAQATTVAHALAEPSNNSHASAMLSAWFIPKEHDAAHAGTAAGQQQQGAGESAWRDGSGTPRAVPPGGAETLRVLHACSPTGQLRKSRQQRKQELKAALKHMLQGGDADQRSTVSATGGPGGMGLEASQLRMDPAGTGLGTRSMLPAAATQHQQSGAAEAVRKVLGRLLTQQEPELQPLVGGMHTRHGPAQGHTQWGTGSGGYYYLPQDVHHVEDAAAAALQQDRQAALEQSRLARMEQLEAAVQQLQQQAQQLTGQVSAHPHPAAPHHLTAAYTGSSHSLPVAASAPAARSTLQVEASAVAAEQQHTAGITGGGGDAVRAAAAPGAVTGDEVMSHPGVTLHRMLAQLQQLEEAEAALRRKYLSGGAATATMPASPHAFTLQHDHLLTGSAADGSAAAAPTALGAQPTAAAAAAAGSSLVPPAAGQPRDNIAVGGAVLQPSGAAGLRSGPEPLTAAVVEEVQEGRRHFLEAQARSDGLLMSHVAGGWVQPQDVVEDIADALLDELLEQHAQDMLSMCDALGEQLLEEELQA